MVHVVRCFWESAVSRQLGGWQDANTKLDRVKFDAPLVQLFQAASVLEFVGMTEQTLDHLANAWESVGKQESGLVHVSAKCKVPQQHEAEWQVALAEANAKWRGLRHLEWRADVWP